MIGEAIVSLNKDVSKGLRFYRKQGMQLLSKMRFVSAQFVTYLSNDLWRENASNANNMGKYFTNRLSEIPGITLKSEPETNMIFAYMEKDLINSLQKKFDFYLIDDETNLIRLVTSFDTSKDDIDNFIGFIKNIQEIE